ncbi:cupin domain-containing protein [Nostocoides sp. Soil756]|uniref:cupin domain-containing protein n=1 Tax=Nostocoides sp. Soil756 TaxID=1736399 RepID=UPI0006F26371|nr:cupin domain-containing protein [Tetrasphaera sp. Soil756]KRE60805.1 hypothetical protein ASG78_10470 [Tetrasphaera sp. Soil756]
MTGSFITAGDISRDTLPWGELGWVVTPTTAPGCGLTVLDVTITPGQGHAFHRHPEQEEVITVVSGTIEQWVEQERTVLHAGESVHVPKDTVHASFVAAAADGPARLSVVLTPSVGDSGYAADEVADQEPWASLR